MSPETVIALRERGWSWMDVAAHLGLRPTVFVRHLPARRGPPYGKAHGYWRNRGYTHLTDRQIVDFVNVRFVADYYRAPVREVIVYRDRGVSFAQIQQRYVQRGSSGAPAAPPPVRRQAPAPASGNRQARPTRNQPAAANSPAQNRGSAAGRSAPQNPGNAAGRAAPQNRGNASGRAAPQSRGPAAGNSPARSQGASPSASPSRNQAPSARGGSNRNQGSASPSSATRTSPDRGSANNRPGNQGRGNARAGSAPGRGNGAARGQQRQRGGGS